MISDDILKAHAVRVLGSAKKAGDYIAALRTLRAFAVDTACPAGVNALDWFAQQDLEIRADAAVNGET